MNIIHRYFSFTVLFFFGLLFYLIKPSNKYNTAHKPIETDEK